MSKVLIQAGHEGRTSGATGAVAHEGLDEIELTPIVADRATELLRAAGYEVIREDATFDDIYECDLFVALHFDGNSTPCASGASVGYPSGVPAGSNKPTADNWKAIYSRYWPYKWMGDNFTKNLSGYYGYKYAVTNIAEMLIEFGEITCPEQNAWLQPRVEWLGDLVAHFVSVELGGTFIPDPGEWSVEPDTYRSVKGMPLVDGEIPAFPRKVVDTMYELGVIPAWVETDDEKSVSWNRPADNGDVWRWLYWLNRGVDLTD